MVQKKGTQAHRLCCCNDSDEIRQGTPDGKTCWGVSIGILSLGLFRQKAQARTSGEEKSNDGVSRHVF